LFRNGFQQEIKSSAAGVLMTENDKARLARVLGMLGSEHDGERANAALTAEKIRRQLGTTWEELLQPTKPNNLEVKAAYEKGLRAGWDEGQRETANRCAANRRAGYEEGYEDGLQAANGQSQSPQPTRFRDSFAFNFGLCLIGFVFFIGMAILATKQTNDIEAKKWAADATRRSAMFPPVASVSNDKPTLDSSFPGSPHPIMPPKSPHPVYTRDNPPPITGYPFTTDIAPSLNPEADFVAAKRFASWRAEWCGMHPNDDGCREPLATILHVPGQ
jgi:hypothetical protein